MSDETRRLPTPDDYDDLLALARTLTVADLHFDNPPASLWAGIEARVAEGDPRAATPWVDAAATTTPAAAPVAPVHQLRARPPRRLPFLLGAAAAFAAAAIGLVAYVQRDDGPSVTSVDEVALVNDGLEPAGATSRGRATLVRTVEGEYALDVQLDDLPEVDGFLELWIIDTEVKGMYSLGPVTSSGRYRLPERVDPRGFPIVDVSIEPTDGQPAHSGKSILRGVLTL
jgi:hypothetical protein